MHDVAVRVRDLAARFAPALVAMAAGSAAVVISQWHVLPPLVCFAVLVMGLATLGVAALLAVQRFHAVASDRRSRASAARPIVARLRAALAHRAT